MLQSRQNALIVQRIEQEFPELQMWVLPHGELSEPG